MRALITGSEGYLGGFISAELLARGHSVVGLDNFVKYGPGRPAFGSHPRYRFVFGDAKDVETVSRLALECDVFIAAAALTGGVGYLDAKAYEILAENERITAAAFDAAVAAHRGAELNRIVLISSSAVYENAFVIPTPESHAAACPAPRTTYGLQKLSAEFFAKSAHEAYGLPYTIIRPFNVAGLVPALEPDDGPDRSGRQVWEGTHVIPELTRKILRGQEPLRILGDGSQVRYFTHGRDLAAGILSAALHPGAENETFNLSGDEAVSVRSLAERLWARLAPGKSLALAFDPPCGSEVSTRAPDVAKAAKILGFQAAIRLDAIIDEVVYWARETMRGE